MTEVRFIISHAITFQNFMLHRSWLVYIGVTLMLVVSKTEKFKLKSEINQIMLPLHAKTSKMHLPVFEDSFFFGNEHNILPLLYHVN